MLQWAMKYLEKFQGISRLLQPVTISKPTVSSFSVELGEYLALRKGLLLAKKLGLSVKVAEVDICNVVCRINYIISLYRDARFIVYDIKALYKEVDVCKYHYICSLGNDFAHNLV
ncbi:hypothetical protein JRO89_XS08G0254200 [Xanthoceras sorbifolium]|uniref:RNase H type-1 domain-containing protein n=1 Tax=Xanthoceras sorbifolium TaxID=99658 RepID=A0ABQ8HRH7_9ROSI|nr:hypothetical protein JRO89_XS08G0254200 [Xanthoceras sorbifolium]